MFCCWSTFSKISATVASRVMGSIPRIITLYRASRGMLIHVKAHGCKIELRTDIDMIMFIERDICGGLNQCSNRYARANNKYMPNDPSKSLSYLMLYYDINNLYGWAMCQLLPYADFRWVDDVHNFDFTIALDLPTGSLLEIDATSSWCAHCDTVLSNARETTWHAR